jgi:hypothetical protein
VDGKLDVAGFAMLLEFMGVCPRWSVIEKYFLRQCDGGGKIDLPHAMVCATGIITSYLTLLRKERVFRMSCEALARPFASLSSWDCYAILKGINDGKGNESLMRYILENSKMNLADYSEERFKIAARDMLDLD